MREARHLIGVLVALLDVHAAAVRKPPLHPRDQVAPAGTQAVIRAFVLQPIVEVEIGPIRELVVGTEPAAGSEIAVGNLHVHAQPFTELVGAADTHAPVVFAILRLRHRVLHECVGTPGCEGVEADLHDRVRPLALLLGQRNDGRVVLAQVLPHAGAHVPVVGDAEADVQLLRRGFQPQVLHSLIGLGVQLQSIAKRHAQSAAVLLAVGEAGKPRSRIASIQALRVERQASPVRREKVVEPDAEIRAVAVGIGISEGERVLSGEAEPAIAGQERVRYRALTSSSLELQP